jgi:acyl-CoA thioester hydrolase
MKEAGHERTKGAEPFAWRVRVYWEDTDGGGIVYYANYLRFMERARTEYLRSAGLNQSELLATRGLVFVITSAHIDYRRPARLDDELLVTCRIVERSRATFSFAQEIHRGSLAGELLVEGHTRVACLENATLRPRPLPDALLRSIDADTGAGKAANLSRASRSQRRPGRASG